MMKSQIWKLFKLQIDEVFDFMKVTNIKKVITSLLKYMIIVMGLTIALRQGIKKIQGYGFEVNTALVSIILFVVFMLLIVFFTSNIIKKLFLSKNNEVLLALPVTANQIFISKILVVYIYDIVFTSAFLIPILLALYHFMKLGFYFYVMLPLIVLILPLGSLAISALLAIPIYQIYQFFKNKTIITTLIILGVVAVSLVFYTNFLGDFSRFDLAGRQIETVSRINFKISEIGSKNEFFYQLASALSRVDDLIYLIIYLVSSLVILMGALLLIKPFFFKITTQVLEENVKIRLARKMKKQKALWSLIKKELLTVMRTPGCVFQYFVFAILMPVFVYLCNRLLLSMDIVTEIGKAMIAGTYILIVAMLAMLGNVFSASAVSREGKSFAIMKIIPVDYYTQTAAKVIFNIIITWTAVIFSGIMVVLTGRFLPHSINIWIVITSTIIVMLISLGHLCLSYDYDLRKPSLSWFDEGNIDKVSANTTKSILWAIVLAGSLCLLVVMLSLSGLKIMTWVCVIVLSLAFCLLFVYRLILRVSYQYEEIEV